MHFHDQHSEAFVLLVGKVGRLLYMGFYSVNSVMGSNDRVNYRIYWLPGKGWDQGSGLERMISHRRPRFG